MWKLKPQPLKEEYKNLVLETIFSDNKEWSKKILSEYFEPFVKEKHFTWQQWLFLISVERAIKGIDKRRISVESGHGCHAIDTEIMMFDGSIQKVQDIKIGDKIMGDDETPRKVLNLKRGIEEMFRIKYFDGTFYDVNKSHILSLVASQTHGKQKTGQQINIPLYDYLKWSDRKKRTNIGYKKSVEFKEKALPIDPYLLGLWLGDGTSSNGNITNMDKEILDYLSTLNTTCRKVKNCYSINTLGLAKILRLNGLKNIPFDYLTSSRQQRLELLAGIIDTDGYLQKDSRCFSIIQKREELAKQIKKVAQSVGMHATLNKTKKSCIYKGERKCGIYYIVNISRNTEIIPCKVKRKQAKIISNPQRNNLYFGFTIETLGEGDYYGFELDKNHLYLLGDFTVTHNTGKSCCLAWLIIWFLFCFKNAQIPCTAPTSSQMHDVLWKELSKWIQKLHPVIKEKFIWTSEYLRINESPETWFARAKTAKKEAPEALAGMHGDYILFVVDEASAVPEEVFNTAEGALTQENILLIMISNHTRLTGYFHNSHTTDKKNWQTLSFNSEQSPIVDRQFVDRIIEKHGKESDEYKIRVQGISPAEEMMDDKGYVPLFIEQEILLSPISELMGEIRMGIDPSGEGQDVTAWIVRDFSKIKILGKELISNPKSIAEKTLTFMFETKTLDKNIMLDNFGAGADVAKEIALSDFHYNIGTVNVGQKADDEIYLNLRAEAFFRLRTWIKNGGTIMDNQLGRELKKELLSLKYRRNETGKIQIMPKLEMKKQGISSPNFADSVMLTFVKPPTIIKQNFQTQGVSPLFPEWGI